MNSKRPTNLLIIFSIWGALCISILILYFLFGRQLIDDIYNQHSLPLLNLLIFHQDLHHLSYYRKMSVVLIIIMFIVGSAGILLFYNFPVINNFIEKRFRTAVIFLYFPYLIYSCLTFIKPGFLTEPISQEDYAFHFTESEEVTHHIINHGSILGYNPILCAGKLCHALDNVWSPIFMLPFSWLNRPELFFNISVFLAYLAGPILALVSVLLLKFKRTESLILFVLSILLVIGFLPLRGFYYAGGYGFATANWLSLFLFALTHYYLTGKQNFQLLVLMNIIAILAIFIHPLTGLIYPAFFIPYALVNYRLFNMKVIVSFTISAILILITSLLWLKHIFTISVIFGSFQGLQTYPSLILKTLRGDRAFLLLNILFFYSVILSLRDKKYSAVITAAITYAYLFAIAFWGTQLKLGAAEPSRFIIPLAISVILFISPVVFQTLQKRNVFYHVITFSLILFLLRPPLHFVYGLRDQSAKAILDFFKEHPANGRLLIQDTQFDRPYFESRCLSLIAYKSLTETTGDTWPFAKFQAFLTDKVFGCELGKFSEYSLKKYLDLYNIRFILLYREPEREMLSKYPFLKERLVLKPFSIFENLSRGLSSIYQGSGKVTAKYDSLIVTEADSSVTILKYHYFPELKIFPENLSIEPIFLGDPVPFIKVNNKKNKMFVVGYW
jgi:hypothetical protein